MFFRPDIRFRPKVKNILSVIHCIFTLSEKHFQVKNNKDKEKNVCLNQNSNLGLLEEAIYSTKILDEGGKLYIDGQVDKVL